MTASSGTGINTFTVNIPSQTSSKTGSCVITYPADSCNRERKETIHLVEKEDPICDTSETSPGCSYRVKKTVITPADLGDMTYGYAFLEF